MADDGPRTLVSAFREKLVTVNGAIATTGVLALVVGLFVHSLTVWIVCGGCAVLAAGYLLLFSGDTTPRRVTRVIGNNVSQTEPPVKTLLFDDYQSHEKNFVVKAAEDEAPVVPSSRETLPVPPEKETKERELALPDFFEFEDDQQSAGAEPKQEFHALLDKILIVLKETLFAHTVAFFWANREKRQMVVEAWVTDSPAFMRERRYAFGQDLVSQVADEGKPQLIGRVTTQAQAELVRYYEVPDPVQSVLAVPVFFRTGEAGVQPVGVIAADSKAEDAFGNETLATTGRFTKMVSALIKSYTDKYDLLLEAELLDAFRRLQDRAKSDPSEENLLKSLEDELRLLVSWEHLTLTMYAEESHGWVVQRVAEKVPGTYVNSGRTIHEGESIVGSVIRSNTLELVSDLSTNTRPRFFAGEPAVAAGTFLCVPISSLNRCYGALTLESSRSGSLSGSEVEVVYRLVEYAAALLEVLYMNTVAREQVPVDSATGALAARHFLRRVEEEVRRAQDFEVDLSLVSLAVDHMTDHAARYGNGAEEAILAELVRVMRPHLRQYDCVGRGKGGGLGMLLVQTTGTDASVWGEKIRKLIAGHVMTIDGRSFSVTVSMGVCGLVEGMQGKDLVNGSAQVLDNALAGGGNILRVF
jgi:diguanylate cyclase (GGDEF)-like protein